MCKFLCKLFKKNKNIKKIVKIDESKITRKRPGPIITDVKDFTSVAKEKKKHKNLFKFVGEHGIKI